MSSGRQLARIMIGKATSLEERKGVAPATWAALVDAMLVQAQSVLDVVRGALEKPTSGPKRDIWVEALRRDSKPEAGKLLLVFLGTREANKKENPQNAAIARFALDPSTCHVVVDRKPFGLPDDPHRYEKLPDLGNVEDITLSAFLEKLVEFLRWASVGEGRGNQRYRFHSV